MPAIHQAAIIYVPFPSTHDLEISLMVRIKSRSRGFIAVSGLLAVVCGLILISSGCGGGESTTPPSVPESASRIAPDFTLNDLDGAPFSLASTTGKIRIIDFWATWCPPCLDEMPMYKELHNEYAAKGVEIIGISMDDESNLEKVRQFVGKLGIEYMILMGTEDVSDAYQAVGMPATYVLDQEGNIVKSFVGTKPKQVLVELIEGLLNHGEDAA
jgi:thiol-disulfide isomerase/thioredoxin